MKKAIILGGSGLVGQALLQLILADNRYNEIIAIGRKPLNIDNPKLKQVTGNLFEMDAFASEFQDGDDLYIAIGTTKAKTPDKKQYEKIDLGIPVAAVKLAERAGIENVCTVSSMGANPKSRIFYSRLKGKMEQLVLTAGIANNTIVRPSMLLGPRQEKRVGESIGKKLMTALDFIIPPKSKAIHVQTVARAMIALNNQQFSKPIWTNDELFKLAASNQN